MGLTKAQVRQKTAVIDGLNDQDIVTAQCQSNGTWPLENSPNYPEGFARDRNDQPYRWTNFFVMEGEDYDRLDEDFEEGEEIPMDLLYEEYNLGASHLERDLDHRVPRGLMAEVTVQKDVDPESGEIQLNVIDYETVAIKNGDRFADEKPTDNNASQRGTPITQQQEDGVEATV